MAQSQTLVEKDLRACLLGKMGHGYDYMITKIIISQNWFGLHVTIVQLTPLGLFFPTFSVTKFAPFS